LALGSLIVVAFGAGWLLCRAIGAPTRGAGALLRIEAAGLGLTAVLLGGLALAGRLSWSRPLLLAGAAVTLAVCVARRRTWAWPRWSWGSPIAAVVLAMIGAGALGAVAPVTEFDSLAYPIPIAQHLAETGAWRYWPGQVRSVFPLAHTLLLVPLIQEGSLRIGLLTAFEFAIVAGLVVSLARRVSPDPHVPWVAAIIALGCPAVAFLVGSVKEDLLLVMMTTGAAIALLSPPGRAAATEAGLFAGLAAGAKLTGLPLALAIVALVPFTCGRHRRAGALVLAASVACVSGGLWYAVNLARFGSPVPLVDLGGWFAPPLLPTPVLADWENGFGTGRSVLDAILAPARMAIGGDAFGGRGNWINAIAFVGLGGLLVTDVRRRTWPLVALFVAAYAAWFREIHVARLLLPALAWLAVPAAVLVLQAWHSARWLRAPAGAVLIASAGVVIAVGLLRAGRYTTDPGGFLARETPYYAEIDWMNAHLDPARDRVATFFEASGYLRIPWIALNATYQAEIDAAEIDDLARLLPALRRQGVTHVFGPPDRLAPIVDQLELIHEHPASRVGGSSFFRDPPTAAVAIYRLPPR
jgi:hypothetical protein